MRNRRHSLLLVLSLLCALASPLLPATAAQASGNAYPYRNATTNTSDPWGFTKRQCVSFAAWELAAHHHAIRNSTQHWGNAYSWDNVARARHKVITTRPKVGAVAQWNANERSTYRTSSGTGWFRAGSFGHVAYVTAVYGDATVRIEQYNLNGNRSFSTMRLKAPRYLYIAG